MSSPSSSAPPSRAAISAGLATIYLVWGSTYLAIRVAVETMPPFLMAAARFLLAGAALFTFLKLRGAPLPTARQWGLNALIGTFLLLGGNGTVVWAEQFVPSGLTALLIGIGPLFIVLIEWAWPGGQRPTLRTAIALFTGFAGVVWLAAPWQNPAQGGLHVGGVLAILAGCLFWSFGSITSRHAKHGADPMMASALQLLCGGSALMIAACVHGDWIALNFPAISARSWSAFFYLVIVGSLIGFSTFVWLMKKCPPAQVATFAYVNPVVAVILGWLILGEPITSRTLVASAIIVSAVVIITLEKNKPARAPAKT
ncbi:MAG: EamA family transporter [Verrucomicrobiota bacterium]